MNERRQLVARLSRLCLLILAVLMFAPTTARHANADAFIQAVQALNAKSFKAKTEAVDGLVALGDGRAVPVLQAFSAGRLFVRKSDSIVVIGARAGGGYVLSDAVTNAPLGEVGRRDVKKISANNKLRKHIRDAVGRLGLFSPKANIRLAAARDLLKNPTADVAGLLRDALKSETNGEVRGALTISLAATELSNGQPQQRIAAIDALAGSLDPNVKALLSRLLLQGSDGRYQEPDATVRAAAAAALTRIDDRLFLFAIGENLFHGLSLGSVLLLAAIGLAITFGVMGVINMAHGEMIMLGAYTTFVVQQAFRSLLPPEFFHLYLLAAIPAAFLVAGAFGVAIERGVIRFLYGRPLETLLATWGVSLILQQFVRSVFGATNREVANPDWMSGAVELAGGVALTYNRIYIIAFAFLVVGVLATVIRFTQFGLNMRAVTQNRGMSAAMGIPTGRVDVMTFGLGSGIAGMAGVALSQITNVSPNLGQGFIVDSFLVVVFGGVGSLWGTVAGALSLGLVNKFLEPFTGVVLAKIALLVLIILFIQKRPRGLFALKGRAAEA